MRIGFYNLNNITYNNNFADTSFCGASSRKLIKKILETDNLYNIKATFDDMVRAYEELGYDIVLKRGSHASIKVGSDYNMSLVIPHGDKYVKMKDVLRLKYVASGDLENARKVFGK